MIQCIPSSTPVCTRVELLYNLAVEGSKTPTADQLERRIRAASPQKTYIAFAQQALREVHKLPYVPDPKGHDCYRDVAYTVANGGECKGLNVLYCAILIRMGIRAEPVWIMQENMPMNHVTSIVSLGGQRLWADASIKGALLGESPYDAVERTGSYHVIGGSVQ